MKAAQKRRQLRKELYNIIEFGAYNGYGVSSELRQRADEILEELNTLEDKVDFELRLIYGK